MPSLSTSSSDLPIDQVAERPRAAQASQARCFWTGILKIAGFFALFIAGAFAIQQVVNFGLRRIPTGEFGVSNRILAGRVNADIVISGSSRAVSHYDPKIIERWTGLKTFNIGRNGSQTDMQLAVLKCYLKHNARPRLVIHNLDMFSLVTSHGEVYDPGQYMPYLNEKDVYQALLQINPEIWKWKYVPLYCYAVDDMRFTWLRGIAGAVGVYPREDTFDGFHPGYTKWTGDFERFKSDNPNGVRFEIEPQGVRDLEELIAICRRQGIPVLLVYSPVYSGMQALEKNHAEVFSKFQALSERWQAPIWDFSSSAICSQRQLFYNSQHLNVEGAESFSQEFAKRLKADYFPTHVMAASSGRPNHD